MYSRYQDEHFDSSITRFDDHDTTRSLADADSSSSLSLDQSVFGANSAVHRKGRGTFSDFSTPTLRCETLPPAAPRKADRESTFGGPARLFGAAFAHIKGKSLKENEKPPTVRPRRSNLIPQLGQYKKTKEGVEGEEGDEEDEEKLWTTVMMEEQKAAQSQGKKKKKGAKSRKGSAVEQEEAQPSAQQGQQHKKKKNLPVEVRNGLILEKKAQLNAQQGLQQQKKQQPVEVRNGPIVEEKASPPVHTQRPMTPFWSAVRDQDQRREMKIVNGETAQAAVPVKQQEPLKTGFMFGGVQPATKQQEVPLKTGFMFGGVQPATKQQEVPPKTGFMFGGVQPATKQQEEPFNRGIWKLGTVEESKPTKREAPKFSFTPASKNEPSTTETAKAKVQFSFASVLAAGDCAVKEEAKENKAPSAKEEAPKEEANKAQFSFAAFGFGFGDCAVKEEARENKAPPAKEVAPKEEAKKTGFTLAGFAAPVKDKAPLFGRPVPTFASPNAAAKEKENKVPAVVEPTPVQEQLEKAPSATQLSKKQEDEEKELKELAALILGDKEAVPVRKQRTDWGTSFSMMLRSHAKQGAAPAL